jgi:hypothetical protein
MRAVVDIRTQTISIEVVLGIARASVTSIPKGIAVRIRLERIGEDRTIVRLGMYSLENPGSKPVPIGVRTGIGWILDSIVVGVR